MNLYIKNMVCDRCINAIRRELDRQGLTYKNVQLGEVELAHQLTGEQLAHLSTRLTDIGFKDLMSDVPFWTLPG